MCSQWNPSTARRCAFCGNDPRSEVDQTAAGRPVVIAASKGAAPPRHVQPHQTASAHEQQIHEHTPETERNFRVALGVMGVGLAIVVLSSLIRC